MSLAERLRILLSKRVRECDAQAGMAGPPRKRWTNGNVLSAPGSVKVRRSKGEERKGREEGKK